MAAVLKLQDDAVEEICAKYPDLYPVNFNSDGQVSVAGDKEQLKQCYYSYYATSADSFDADSWITSFNLNQEKVWYTANAAAELENYYWNTYYNTECDPFELPYKPGGLLFFNWDGDGGSFDHVAIVVSYDKDTHVLTYTNGTSGGQVITRQIDLDVEEEFRGTRFTKNANRIVAYGEYDKIEPFEQRTINCEIDSITWDKEASSGIRFQTDSKSKVFKAAVDGEYLGSNIESNMILQQGKVLLFMEKIKSHLEIKFLKNFTYIKLIKHLICN